MKPNRRFSMGLAGCGLLSASLVVQALEYHWFESDQTGQVVGELRLTGLDKGPITINIPNQTLEHGMMRIGNRAIVILAEPSGSDGSPITTEAGVGTELMLVAIQGDNQVAATFPLTQSAPVVSIPTPATSQPTADIATYNEAPSATPTLPAPCPMLAVRPGSLRRNVSRLLADCGARMGRWITSGTADNVRVDWIVRDPTVLTTSNTLGLAGLLDQLLEHFRLQGVTNHYTEAIDIYVSQPKVAP